MAMIAGVFLGRLLLKRAVAWPFLIMSPHRFRSHWLQTDGAHQLENFQTTTVALNFFPDSLRIQLLESVAPVVCEGKNVGLEVMSEGKVQLCNCEYFLDLARM